MTVASSHPCGACGASGLQRAFDLPAFPLTGIFVPHGTPARDDDLFDQAVDLCPACGHMQLVTRVPPSRLYGQGYANRSANCHATSGASAFLMTWLDRLLDGRKADCLLEIGCNDLTMLRVAASRAKQAVGIDPVWLDTPLPADLPDGLSIIGNFIENVDFAADLPAAPDVIFSTHNLEHINFPQTQFARLLDSAAPGALLVIEVPDSDAMVRKGRFDQVFHQHVHYFGLSSFLAFFEAIGAEYVTHAYDRHNWGGSLLIVARKPGGAPLPAGIAQPRPQLVPAFTTAQVAQRFGAFQRRMADFMDVLNDFDGPLYGYGAGQMVPSVAYHLASDLSCLTAILDDSADRHGLSYPRPAVPIAAPGSVDLAEAGVVILALDGVRPIMNRLRDLRPRQIFIPIFAV